MLIGSVDIGNARGPISATRLRDTIANGLAYTLMKRAVERQIGDTEPPPALSADVRRVGRDTDVQSAGGSAPLSRARSSTARRSRPLEMVVVDNRPGPSSPTRAVVAEFPESSSSRSRVRACPTRATPVSPPPPATS